MRPFLELSKPSGINLISSKSSRLTSKKTGNNLMLDNSFLDSADCGVESFPSPSKSIDSHMPNSSLQFPHPPDNPIRPSPESTSLTARVSNSLRPSPEQMSVSVIPPPLRPHQRSFQQKSVDSPNIPTKTLNRSPNLHPSANPPRYSGPCYVECHFLAENLDILNQCIFSPAKVSEKNFSISFH